MRYLQLLAAFAAEAWAMEPGKLSAITEFLMFKAQGGQLTDAEIEARVDGRRLAAVARREGDVAVLPLVGVISQRASLVENTSTGGGVSADGFAAQFRGLMADDTVKAIVLDVHSPGGTVGGVEALADEIRAARGGKPILAQVNTLAASAAYWIASQADEIVLTPGAEAGSIGVYTVHEDVREKLAKEGVKPTLIKAGANKAELAGFVELTGEAMAAAQDRVNVSYRAFVRSVAAGRQVDEGAVEDRMGQGRMFIGDQLLQRGMADRIETLQATLARLGAAPVPASTRSRSAFASGDTPQLATIEGVLREAGFPKALAMAFVSHGKVALRGEPGLETVDLAAAARSLRETLAALR